MTKEEVINTLRNARSSTEMLRGDTMEWYYRYFNHMDDEQRRRIFDKDVAFKIGKAIEASMEEMYSRIERGEKRVPMWNGATWYVKHESTTRKRWDLLVAAAIKGVQSVVTTCKQILYEIGILTLIEEPPQKDKRDQYENSAAESIQPNESIPF